MTDNVQRMCVLLPCAQGQRWAVPQSSLAEILTVPASDDSPPAEVTWRGVEVPVMDFGAGGDIPWRHTQSGTGLIVVVLGVRGEGFDYWGLALRGDGLAVRNIQEEDCEDLPDAREVHSLAAFSLDGIIYQVPDLPALQSLAMEVDKAIPA